MKQTHEQKTNGLIRLLRDQSGVSIVLVIFVMLVFSAIGYSLTNMMVAKQKSVPVTTQSSNAFSAAEGGMNYAGKYLSDLVSWIRAADQTKALGDGSFTISFSGYDYDGTKEWITVTSTGNYGDGKRVLSASFERDMGFGCTP
jgi:hypothetical protein